MSRRYGATAELTPVAANDSIWNLIAATTVKPGIYDLILGCATTPADVGANIQISRTTADGTATSVTPLALDPDDVAALSTFKSDYTAEPTYTASTILMSISMNQRATFRWVAAPGGELYANSLAANGLGCRFVATGSTVAWESTIHWVE